MLETLNIVHGMISKYSLHAMSLLVRIAIISYHVPSTPSPAASKHSFFSIPKIVFGSLWCGCPVPATPGMCQKLGPSIEPVFDVAAFAALAA